jgi:hypothetical protein
MTAARSRSFWCGIAIAGLLRLTFDLVYGRLHLTANHCDDHGPIQPAVALPVPFPRDSVWWEQSIDGPFCAQQHK